MSGGKWGLCNEWDSFGRRISLGWGARSILSNFFLECILFSNKTFGVPNGDEAVFSFFIQVKGMDRNSFRLELFYID